MGRMRRPRSSAALHSHRRHGAGFTLIELILVLVMTATLAVFALPKLVEVGFWRSHAFGTDMLGQVEALQRQALVQQRTITVTFAASGLSFLDATNNASLGTLPCPSGLDPCIHLGAGTSVTFNSVVNGQRSGRSTTSTGTALVIRVGPPSGAASDYRDYRVENETGLIYPAP